MLRLRRTILVAAAVIGLAAATTGPADAGVIGRSYTADATTTVKKLGQVVVFPTTTYTTHITVVFGQQPTLTGTLVLPPATTTLKLGSLGLVDITMSAADPSPVTGTIDFEGTLWHVSADQTFNVRIDKISPHGVPWINLVGSTCHTDPTTAHLTGTIDWSKIGQSGGPGDYTMAGTYPIPSFKGCGVLNNPLLTTLVSGPGNPISLHLTKPVVIS